MRTNKSKGTPEQFLNAVKNRIASLRGDPVESASGVDKATQEVLDFLESKGYDVSNKQVKNYADAVAEYVDMVREAQGNYTMQEWYSDTKSNYPEELEDLPIMEASRGQGLRFDKVTHDTVEASEDDEYGMEYNYIYDLQAQVDRMLEGEVDSTVWDDDEDQMYLTVTFLGDNINDYEIPYEDLSDDIEEDAAYIVNTVLADLDEA